MDVGGRGEGDMGVERIRPSDMETLKWCLGMVAELSFRAARGGGGGYGGWEDQTKWYGNIEVMFGSGGQNTTEFTLLWSGRRGVRLSSRIEGGVRLIGDRDTAESDSAWHAAELWSGYRRVRLSRGKVTVESDSARLTLHGGDNLLTTARNQNLCRSLVDVKGIFR